MEIDSELIRLLMETGYLACGNGLFKESETIFGALATARPESEYPYIGMAVTKMNSGAPEEAVRLIRHRALTINPGSDLAKSFLGLALKLSGNNNECEKVLDEVIETGTDETAVKMARSLLE